MRTRFLSPIGLLVIMLVLGFSIYTGPTPALATAARRSVRALAPAVAGTIDVRIEDFDFAPADILIPVGTTVHWHNFGGFTHTATSVAPVPVFNSGNVVSGADFGFLFTQKGVYSYHCSIHPSMTGSVTVVGRTFLPMLAR